MLPNKPLSILEITDTAKSGQYPALEEYFCEIVFQEKIKKIECGILNIDARSEDGTHWVGRFRTGKDKSIATAMECNLPTIDCISQVTNTL